MERALTRDSQLARRRHRLGRRVPVARRNLTADRRRLLASVVGIGLAVMLILLQGVMMARRVPLARRALFQDRRRAALAGRGHRLAQMHRDDEQLVRSRNPAYLHGLEQHQAGLDQMLAKPTP
jgi:hypothetical protein